MITACESLAIPLSCCARNRLLVLGWLVGLSAYSGGWYPCASTKEDCWAVMAVSCQPWQFMKKFFDLDISGVQEDSGDFMAYVEVSNVACLRKNGETVV